MRIAILPSTDVFEDHFGLGLGLAPDDLGSTYVNDFLFQYALLLTNAGHDVDVVLLSSQLQAKRTTVTQYGYSVSFVPLGGMARVLLRFRRTPPIRWIVSFLISGALIRIAPTFDVIYCQEYASGRYCRLANANRRHGTWGLIGAHHGRGISPWHARAIRACRNKRAVLTALTAWEAKALNTALPSRTDRILQLPNPVNANFFAPTGQRRQGVLMVARLFDDQKKISDTLTALAQLPADLWRPLVVAGDGPDRARLVALASELGMASNVRFLGLVLDRRALAQLYNSCRIFLMPSAYEGLPIAVLEAQAAGAVPIVSDIPAFDEAVPGLAPRVRVGDIAGIAAAVLQLAQLGDEELEFLSARVRQHVVSQFSEERFLGMIETACERSRRGVA